MAAVHEHPATQHQALCEVLLKTVMEAGEGALSADARCTQARLAACLKTGEYIFHDVAVFVVELLKCVSINIIMGEPGLGALTVTRFAGEKVTACECWPAGHAFVYFMPAGLHLPAAAYPSHPLPPAEALNQSICQSECTPLFAGCTMAVSAAQRAYPQSFCGMPRQSLSQVSIPSRSMSSPPCLQPR